MSDPQRPGDPWQADTLDDSDHSVPAVPDDEASQPWAIIPEQAGQEPQGAMTEQPVWHVDAESVPEADERDWTLDPRGDEPADTDTGQAEVAAAASDTWAGTNWSEPAVETPAYQTPATAEWAVPAAAETPAYQTPATAEWAVPAAAETPAYQTPATAEWAVPAAAEAPAYQTPATAEWAVPAAAECGVPDPGHGRVGGPRRSRDAGRWGSGGGRVATSWHRRDSERVGCRR